MSVWGISEDYRKRSKYKRIMGTDFDSLSITSNIVVGRIKDCPHDPLYLQLGY